MVIGIIGVLAGAVFVALNPPRRFAQARNAQRESDVISILNAILSYQLDNDGQLPTGISDTFKMIGSDASGCNVTCGQEQAGETTVYATADSFMYEASPNSNFGTDSQIQEYPWEPSWTKRGLLKFDFSSIPTGATITSATLFLKETQTFGSTRTIGLYPVGKNWVEGEVTWNKFNSTDSWTTPGGDFETLATSTASVTWTGELKWDSWDVAEDIQAFIDGVKPNYGWVIKDESEDSSQHYWFFSSREDADLPYIEITYTTGGGDVTASSCLNLSSPLTPGYISQIPIDPRLGSSGKTYYAVHEITGGQIQVMSCAAEFGEFIETTK